MKKLLLSLLAVVSALFMLPLAAADIPAGWTANYEQALAQAQKENKNVLVLFTGSDWCPYCVKLHNEVLAKPEFKAFAKDKFVLVYIDFPNGKKQTDEEKKYNKALEQKIGGVSGYPSTVILDKNGKELGRVGGFTPQYIQALENAVKPDTPLCDAVKANRIDEVKKLLAAGAKVNQVGKDGVPPLILAFARGSEEMAILLLDNGADAKYILPGRTPVPLICAAIMEKASPKIIAKLIEKGADVKTQLTGMEIYPIHFAALAGTPELFEQMVKAGANPKQGPADGGMTLLHLAAAGNNAAMVEYLLKNGAQADITAKNKDGMTPAECAKNPAVKKLLQPAAK